MASHFEEGGGCAKVCTLENAFADVSEDWSVSVEHVFAGREELFVDLQEATEAVTEYCDWLVLGHYVPEGAEDASKFCSVDGIGGTFAGWVDHVALLGADNIHSRPTEGGGANGGAAAVSVDVCG